MSKKIDELLKNVRTKNADDNPMRIERLKRGLTIENIANILKLSIGAIGNYEVGRFPCPLTRLHELADLYEIDHNTFINDYGKFYSGK